MLAVTEHRGIVTATFATDVLGPRTLFNRVRDRFRHVELSSDTTTATATRLSLLQWLQIQFAVSIVLCIPLFLLSFVFPHTAVAPALNARVLGGTKLSMVLAFFFATPVVALGYQTYWAAVRALTASRLNMSVLISLSVLTAYFYSCAMSIVLFAEPALVAEVFFEV